MGGALVVVGGAGLPVVFLAMAPMLGLSVIAGTWLGWAEFYS